MSRNQRIALVAATVVVAVVAFVIAKPGDDDDEPATGTSTAQTETTRTQTETVPTEPEAKPAVPKVTRIEVKGGRTVGGVESISVKRGDTVRLAVTSADTSDEVHIHGYDLTENVTPAKPARFVFKANIEGVFEAELHGDHTQIASLKVEPR